MTDELWDGFRLYQKKLIKTEDNLPIETIHKWLFHVIFPDFRYVDAIVAPAPRITT
jgi:hypothetical protein